MHRSPEYVVKFPLIGCVSGHVQASCGGTPGRDGVCAAAVDAASTIHHWMISSARPSSDGGIVRPSALAVLRLISMSNLDACITGRSAGRAPLSILSI